MSENIVSLAKHRQGKVRIGENLFGDGWRDIAYSFIGEDLADIGWKLMESVNAVDNYLDFTEPDDLLFV